MNLNFMHILADLGFHGVSPVYWINESKACHRFFKRQKRYNLDKIKVKQESTQKCEATTGYPNYIKESNQHKIESKVHQVNKAKANEHKG
jgi:hypothetical protein